MKHPHYFLALSALLCLACGHHRAQTSAPTVTDTITSFVYPQIPAALQTHESRAAYMVEHFWEGVNFADTNYVHHPEVVEQAWVNFVDILPLVPADVAAKALRNLVQRAAASRPCLDYVTGLAEKYLYDPNSPMRNEEYYIPMLEELVQLPLLSDAEKARPADRLQLALRNRPGTVAMDFAYTTAGGGTGRLHQLRADFLVLYINNPGCHACAETTGQLKSLPTLNRLLAEGRLKVLSLYPDEELDEWRRHLPELPRTWVRARDASQDISRHNLYDLKAIPTLYLLDAGKTVLLKDTTTDGLEQYLSAL